MLQIIGGVLRVNPDIMNIFDSNAVGSFSFQIL